MNLEKALSILGLTPNFTEEQLKSRYRILAKKYHPDLHDGSEDAASKMKQVNEAKTYLERYLKDGGKKAYCANEHYSSYNEKSYVELREEYIRELKKYEIKCSKVLSEKLEEFKKMHNAILKGFFELTRNFNKTTTWLTTLFKATEGSLLESYDELRKLLVCEMTEYALNVPYSEEKEILIICQTFLNTLRNKEFDSDLLEKYALTIEKIKEESERIREFVEKYAQNALSSVIEKYSGLVIYENIKQEVNELKNKALKEFKIKSSSFDRVVKATDVLKNLTDNLDKSIMDIINREKELDEHRKKACDEIETLFKSDNVGEINLQEIIASINMAKSKKEINSIVENTKKRFENHIYEFRITSICTKMINHANKLISLNPEIKETLHISRTLATVLLGIERIKENGQAQKFLEQTCANIDFGKEESLFQLASILEEEAPEPTKGKEKRTINNLKKWYMPIGEKNITINNIKEEMKEEILRKKL